MLQDVTSGNELPAERIPSRYAEPELAHINGYLADVNEARKVPSRR